MRKYLVTADIHFERIVKEEKHIEVHEYFIDTIRNVRPEIFIIAGDVTDSRNLRIESFEAYLLEIFIMNICSELKKYGGKLLVIRGTPSHDGDVMKFICHTMTRYFKDTVTYVDSINKVFLNGTSIICIPEIYKPTYQEFLDELYEVAGDERFDICVFHNMMDFAIPAVSQIDSKFNVSRCVVIDTDTISELANVCIGGHVHSYIHNKNVYYTGRCINEVHQKPDSDEFGIKLLTLTSSNSYEIENITNPFLFNQTFIELDFSKLTLESLSDIMYRSSDSTVYLCKYTSGEQEDLFREFVKIYKPKHVKKIKQGAVKSTGLKKYTQQKISSEEDVINILKSVYKDKYAEDLPDSVIKMIVDEGEK